MAQEQVCAISPIVSNVMQCRGLCQEELDVYVLREMDEQCLPERFYTSGVARVVLLVPFLRLEALKDEEVTTGLKA